MQDSQTAKVCRSHG